MPRLSVIIPIYDVEPYLAACLDSVAAQTWEDIEVVMVDDGSPDSSAEIAARFAERDRRFRLVRQPNAGLGAARNTGVRHAAGEFLAFVDSDDLLPPHALDYLLAALQRTGSDLATGNVLRFDGRRTRQSAMHRAVFARPAVATHVTRHSALLRDRLVTNKLWRRSFWDAHGFAFPEGVLYEDISVALRAHFLAGTVDVLPAPVYLWRERDGGSRSITQDKTQAGHLEDRFAAVRSVRGFLADHHLIPHIAAWDHTVLDTDLTNFLDVLDQASDAFRSRFLDLANEYLDGVSRSVLDGLPALRRVEWHLVARRRLEDLLEVLAWDRRVKPDERLVRRLWRYHLDLPLTRGRDPGSPAAVSRVHDDDPGIPAAVSRVRDELAPAHRIDAVRWEDGRLVVEGRVAPACLRPTRRFHQQVFAALVQEGTGRRIRVPASVTRARVSPRSKERDWGGFRLLVDPRLLDRPDRLGLWHVELRVIHRGLIRRARLADPRATWIDQVGCRNVGHDRYVAPLLTESGDLALRAERETARVIAQRASGDRLRLVGHMINDLGAEPVLVVTRRPGGVPLSCPVTMDRRTFEAEVRLRDLLPARRPETAEVSLLDVPAEWRVEVRAADGTVTPVTVVEDLPPGRYGIAGREIVALRDRSGCLILRDQPVAAFVDLAEWLPGGELLIEGGFAVPYGVAGLVVSSLDRPDERLAPIEGAGTRFRARLAPEAIDSLAGRLPLPRGRYGLAIRVEGDGRDIGSDIPIEFDSDSPLVHETARRTFEFGASGTGHAVLTVGSDLSRNERGRKAQHALRTEAYPAMRGRPLRPAVLFSSHAGTRFAGSPKAIYEELRRRGLDLTFLWHVRDGQVALPGAVDPVRSQGREYYEALARCRYIVVDDDLPAWFDRRPGQTVVQTWHGPPAGMGGEAEGRPEGSAREWTHLVSPGPWWTPLLLDAFEFTGDVLETGLPCDDILSAPGREAAAAEVRRRIGTPAGRRVVLYVPGGQGTAPLDLEQMRPGLGDDHVVLVWRPPGAATPAVPATEFARDVSAYPDVHELYLVADVLVTDRLMFDFAVTGRPMLFHMDGHRHLDFHAEAPGPSLRTTGEVVEAIRNIDEVAEKYAGMLDSFAAKYRPLADGGAASRLAEQVFG